MKNFFLSSCICSTLKEELQESWYPDVISLYFLEICQNTQQCPAQNKGQLGHFHTIFPLKSLNFLPVLSTVSLNAGIRIEICSQRTFTYKLIPRPSNIFSYQALQLPLTPKGFNDLKSFEETSGLFFLFLHTYRPHEIMIIQMELSTTGHYSSMKRKRTLEYKISSLNGGIERNPTEWVSQAQICHRLTASREEWLQESQCYIFFCTSGSQEFCLSFCAAVLVTHGGLQCMQIWCYWRLSVFLWK